MTVRALDATTEVLQQVLTRTARRAEVVASNIANVDTPGYRALDVYFPQIELESNAVEPQLTGAGHLTGWSEPGGTMFEAPVTRIRADGNTVDVDHEMTLLAMTQGRYRSAAEMVRKRFALLIYAATDGRAGG